MKVLSVLLLLAASISARAQAPEGADPLKSLSFLVGTWDAKGKGMGGVVSNGSYTFRAELGGHVLARHSTTKGDCSGPANFDCDHGDLLYVFQDGPGQPLKAIYFDNEGHVIHYAVSTPSATSVVFLSDESQAGPRFRLMYELAGGSMAGRFQVQIPGQTEWRSYLEWRGAKK